MLMCLVMNRGSTGKRDKATLLALLVMYDKDLVVESEGGGWVRVRVRHHS
jgi:hypothetical protein